MPGSRKKGYVRVPLSPVYVLDVLVRTEKQNNPTAPPYFVYPAQLTYSKADINGIVPTTGETPHQVQLDLPRTPWRFGKKKKLDRCGTATSYQISLLRENVTPQENKLYIKWQANSQTLVYQALDSQKGLNEGVITGDILKTRLGAERYNVLTRNLMIFNSEEFLKKNTITKTTLVDLLGESESAEFIKSFKLKDDTEGSLPFNDLLKEKLVSKVLSPFLEDLLRITSQAGHTPPTGPDTTIQDMVTKSSDPESGLNLTEDEARALCAFRCSIGKDKILQGGIFSFPDTSMLNWHQSIWLHFAKTSDYHVIRNEQNQLEVIYTYYANFPSDIPDGVTMGDIVQDAPLLIYTNHYKMQKEGDGFTLTRMDNKEDGCAAWFEENFFHNVLIPAVRKKLKTTHFSEEDLLLFIPFLSHEVFAYEFSTKLLSQSPIPKETLNFLVKHIALCFGELGFWNRHQGKISLSIAGLFLGGLLVGGIVVSFGLPVVIGALGGVLFFALVTAAVSITMAVIGGLVGSKIDSDYILPLTLKNIKTKSEKELVEQEEVADTDVQPNKTTQNKDENLLLDSPSGEETTDEEDEEATTHLDDLEVSSSGAGNTTDSDSERPEKRGRKDSGSTSSVRSEVSVASPEEGTPSASTPPPNPVSTGSPVYPPVFSPTSPKNDRVSSPTPQNKDAAKKTEDEEKGTVTTQRH